MDVFDHEPHAGAKSLCGEIHGAALQQLSDGRRHAGHHPQRQRGDGLHQPPLGPGNSLPRPARHKDRWRHGMGQVVRHQRHSRGLHQPRPQHTVSGRDEQYRRRHQPGANGGAHHCRGGECLCKPRQGVYPCEPAVRERLSQSFDDDGGTGGGLAGLPPVVA